MNARTEFVQLFNESDELLLDNGCTLSNITVAYQTYGKLNSDGTNVILICHALTGNAHAAGILNEIENDVNSKWNCLKNYSGMNLGKPGWWDGLIGKGKAFDTDKYFVICPNILGSCYGTTGPASINPANGETFGSSFPLVTIRDMIKVQFKLLKSLGINKIKCITGGSVGGMQVLEWAVMYPGLVESIIPIATASRSSDWAIGLNEMARRAIFNDPQWKGSYYTTQPSEGLKIARMVGMMSYRSYSSFRQRFDRSRLNNGDSYFDTNNLFQVQSYLNYQGEKLVKRFDANSYLSILSAADLHDMTYGRGKIEEVLGSISAKTVCVGINTDVLYPAEEQKEIASLIPGAIYKEISSIYGHDAFLIEMDQISSIVTNTLE